MQTMYKMHFKLADWSYELLNTKRFLSTTILYPDPQIFMNVDPLDTVRIQVNKPAVRSSEHKKILIN